jgi:hypothetical protein
MTSSRFGRLGRLSIVWPLLIIVAAVVWGVYLLGGLQGTLLDLMERSWPALLVLAGLMLLLGRRVRLGNLLAIVLCVALVGGVMATAYSQQASKFRTDNRKPFSQPVDSGVTDVKIITNTLITEIEITLDNSSKPTISGEFVGSRESLVTSDYQVDGSTGTFTLDETPSSAIPALESVGRGRLTLRLPVGVTIDQVSVTGQEGNLSFDAADAAIKNLSLSMGGGNLNVKLPGKASLIGDLKTGRGNVVLQVPESIPADIALRGGGADSPEYNRANYTLSAEKVLVSKRAADSQISVDAPGRITVQ